MLDEALSALAILAAVAAQPGIDVANAGFWDELCGTNLAREIGITDASPASLERFDRAYFDLYPYLAGYLRAPEMAGRRVLEVGLGYGTVAELLARAGADYHGLDIADGPVAMARARLERVPGARPEQVQQGSALELPFPDASFDRVVSIGCLHHTGDLARAVAEVRRVLRPGGELLLMVYNRHSARRVLLWPLLAARHRLVAGAPTPEEWLRHANDGTADGDARAAHRLRDRGRAARPAARDARRAHRPAQHRPRAARTAGDLAGAADAAGRRPPGRARPVRHGARR